MTAYKTLDTGRAGERFVIKTVRAEGAARRRLLDLGFTPGTAVTVHNVAPFGGTVLVGLRGYMLALRENAARLIEVAERNN
jgi:Fe2+ transport system protein FeoA